MDTFKEKQIPSFVIQLIFFKNEKHITLLIKKFHVNYIPQEAYFSIWSFKNREPKTLKSECKP